MHLPPLPGYPGSPGMDALVEHALHDLGVYAGGGLDGVLVENEHDRPHRILAGRETVAAMSVIVREVVRAASGLPVGAEILLNDPEASLAVALAAGAAFVRTDYLVDAMRRPEYGRMRIDPAGLAAYRRSLGAQRVLVLADVQVKYAEMLRPRSLHRSVALAAANGADAVIVSGDRTGEPPSEADLAGAAGPLPVLVGSGTDAANLPGLLRHARGAVVGTSLLADGRADPARVAALVEARG